MMAEEEKKQAEEGAALRHEVGASAFLILGMNIEQTQWVLHHPLSFYLHTNHAYRQSL